VSEPIVQIGKYQILEQVGEGAMGIVYRAMDPILNRPVAIKVMNEGMAQDSSLRERFLREAQAAGSLQHPNVVTIYDFGETDGHLFIAMEYITGADLEHLLRHHAPLSLAAKLDIMIDVLNGLSYAHRRGVIHRDIKPANIRVDEDGHARIMDFGVARLATSNLTSTGVMMGTPNYMAPEQISGEAVTPSVDIFSAGAVLYELLTNAKPFSGDTLHSVLFKIVSDVQVDVRELQPDLPQALNEVVNKALAKTPEQRFRSAAEMGNALQAIRAPLGPARVSKTVSQRVSIEKGLQAQREKHNREVRARRLRIAGSIAAALVVVAGGAYALLSSRSSPAAVTTPPAVTTAPVVDSTAARAARAAADSAAARASASQAAVPAVVAPTPQPSTRTVVEPPNTSKSAARPTVSAPRIADNSSPRVTTKTTEPAAAPITQGATTQPAPLVSSPAPVVSSPVVTPPVAQQQLPAPPPASTLAPSESTKRAAPTLESSRAAIVAIVNSYVRAIGSRDVAAVKRVYPGLTTQQESNWQTFFGSVRSIAAVLDVGSLDVSGATAVAQLEGTYEYVTRAGRTERQQVSQRAVFEFDGERWKLQSVR